MSTQEADFPSSRRSATPRVDAGKVRHDDSIWCLKAVTATVVGGRLYREPEVAESHKGTVAGAVCVARPV